MRARSAAVLAAVTLLGVAACSDQSAAPLVQRLEAAPVPEGAVEVDRQDRDGDFERGPTATLENSLPSPLPAACPELLRGFIDADYTLFQYVEPSPAIADPEAWCEAQAQTPLPDDVATSDIIAVVFPPGVDTEYLSDGFTAMRTKPKTGDALPDGTHLRLSQ